MPTYTGVTLAQGAQGRGPTAYIDVSQSPYNCVGGAVGDAQATLNATAIQAAIDFTASGSLVWLPSVYMVNSQIKLKNQVRLCGMEARGAGLKAGPSFPINTPLLRIGPGTSSLVFNASVWHLRLDCADVTGGICMYTNEAQEGCGIYHCLLENFKDIGAHFDNPVGVSEGICYSELTASSVASANACVRLERDSMTAPIHRCTIKGGSSSFKVVDGVYVDTDCFAYISSCHFENCTDAIQIQGTAVVDNITVFQGGSGNVPNIVHIASGATAQCRSIKNYNLDNAIVDDNIPRTLTGAIIEQYTTGRSYQGTMDFVTNPADTKVSGLTQIFTAGELLARGDICYMKNDGKMWKADADAVAQMPAVALATAAISASASGVFLMQGIYRDDTLYAWTVGAPLYMGQTAGTLWNAKPAGAGTVVQYLAVALTADCVYFNPSLYLLVN